MDPSSRIVAAGRRVCGVGGLWLALVCALALAGCDDEAPPLWSPDLVPCDAREVACVERLARGLAALHGVPWPDDIVVEIEESGGGSPEPPFDWWFRAAQTPPSPFDVLDRSSPPIISRVGSVRVFGDDRLVFRINPRVTRDPEARHRVGLIYSLSLHLRGRVMPGHPLDAYANFPTETTLRSAVRTALALMIEQAIRRADAGEPPWHFSAEQYAKVQQLRAEESGPELVALARLHALHDPDDPRALLLFLPAAIARGCLIGFDLDDASRCVHVEPAVFEDEIEGFVARGADAADGVLLEEALRQAEHPAADFALDLRAHLGRDYTRADGAGVRRDTFVFFDAATARGFADTLAAALDDDDRWQAGEDGQWLFVGDDDAPPGGEARLMIDGAEVVRVAGTDGVDTTPFLEGAGVIVEPMSDPPVLEDVPCEARPPLPCDVRTACCRERLVEAAEQLLGPMPDIRLRVIDPETAVQIYVGPQWADDRLASRITARVRFANGVDHTLRESNDAAAEEQARRVLAWYYNTLRAVFMVVPTAPLDERDLLRENSTVVHELAHAWQDARYGLSATRLAARARSSDAEAAWVTRVEGHAEMVAEVFEVMVEGQSPDALDWQAWADALAARMREALDEADEPARTHNPWLPYVGGLATAARVFDGGADLVAVGDRITASPDSTGAVLGAVYEVDAAPADAFEWPTAAEGDDGMSDEGPLFGTVLAHRGAIGPWPLALRLTPSLGGSAAIDAALGVTSAREAVALHPDGPLTWIEVRADFAEDTLADGLDGLGLALAERTGGVYRLERAARRSTLVVAPTEALLDATLGAIR